MNPHSGHINRLVVHHSASPKTNVTAQVIRDWHVDGNGWSDIGYHYVIPETGIVEFGRPVQFQGAHARGNNDRTLGICVVGDNTEEGEGWNRDQFHALISLIRNLERVFPYAECYGHRDLSSGTECPGLDVRPLIYGPDHGRRRG